MTTSLTDRVTNKQIREWGETAGWPGATTSTGRLPAGLREAYEAFHGVPAGSDLEESEPGEIGDGDLAAADEDGLDDDEPAGSAEEGPAGPPPPSNLDEARERAGGAFPAPKRGKKQRDPKPKPPPVKVTKAVVGDIEGKLAFWLSLTAEPWAVADYCGQVYADQVPAIAGAAAPLICQSPDLVRWFSKSSTFIMWTELGIAVRPVVTAVIKHHVMKVVDETGRPAGVVQAGQQPAAREDFSAYAGRPAA